MIGKYPCNRRAKVFVGASVLWMAAYEHWQWPDVRKLVKNWSAYNLLVQSHL